MSKKKRAKVSAKQKTPTENPSRSTGRKPIVEPTNDWRWKELADAHPHRQELNASAIYALPPPLIKAIRKELPDFFDEDDMRFEQDLVRLGGGGFFHRRPIVYPLLPDPKLSETEASRWQELSERTERSGREIEQMLLREKEADGWSVTQIDSYAQDERAFNERLEERQWGYIGWLVTDARFRRTRDQLRTRWATTIENRGRFPEIPRSWLGERPPAVPESERELYDDFHSFYRNWGLDRLVTWELPIPMTAGLNQSSLYFSPSVTDAGCMMFVPWYLFRDRDLKLREVAEHQREFHAPKHLQDWLSGKPQKWGFDRFAKMLQLYMYLELALKSRYSERLRGCTEPLQYALGGFLYQEERTSSTGFTGFENVKKIRQEMNRRLR